MPLQLTPQNLQQVMDVPVGLYPESRQFLSNASQNDSNMLQEQNLSNMFSAQANPLRVRGLELGNQTAEAGLPGVVAQSSMARRRDQTEALLQDSHIKDLMSKYSSDELARHVKDGEAVGQIALQGAEHVWSNPLGGKEMVKAQMSKMGMWNPAWDNLSPQRLAMELSNFGQGIQATNAKMATALQQTEMKTNTARDIAELAAQTRLNIEAVKNQLQKEKQAAVKTNDPKTLEQGFTINLQRAQQAQSPEEKQMYLEAAAEFQQQYEAALRLRATAASGAKVDVPAVADLPRVQVPGLPPVGTPKAPQPKPGDKLPDGSTFLG
jgi:hypothetical protein